MSKLSAARTVLLVAFAVVTLALSGMFGDAGDIVLLPALATTFHTTARMARSDSSMVRLSLLFIANVSALALVLYPVCRLVCRTRRRPASG